MWHTLLRAHGKGWTYLTRPGRTPRPDCPFTRTCDDHSYECYQKYEPKARDNPGPDPGGDAVRNGLRET